MYYNICKEILFLLLIFGFLQSCEKVDQLPVVTIEGSPDTIIVDQGSHCPLTIELANLFSKPIYIREPMIEGNDFVQEFSIIEEWEEYFSDCSCFKTDPMREADASLYFHYDYTYEKIDLGKSRQAQIYPCTSYGIYTGNIFRFRAHVRWSEAAALGDRFATTDWVYVKVEE